MALVPVNLSDSMIAKIDEIVTQRRGPGAGNQKQLTGIQQAEATRILKTQGSVAVIEYTKSILGGPETERKASRSSVIRELLEFALQIAPEAKPNQQPTEPEAKPLRQRAVPRKF
jgi:Arc/MetJ-type ribon-helix-helix transcriptional regulator